MNCTRWFSIFLLALVFAWSTACLTLFPGSETPEPTPTEDEWFEPHLEPLLFNPLTLPTAQAGILYEVEIRVTGNVTPVDSFMVEPGTLPPGLELIFLDDGTDTATIAGIPERVGTYTFLIEVQCLGTQVSGQTGGKEYTIVVE